MISRRDFLKLSALTGASVLLYSRCAPLQRMFIEAKPPLDVEHLPKFVDPLVIPPAMPRTAENADHDYYEIAVRQFEQQVLPTGSPKTTVWGYGSANHPETFNYPSFTIEAIYGRATRVKWMNQLVDADGKYLPHLLPVDQTLHWANPAGPETDIRPVFTGTPEAYTGPVPMVTHVHGAHAHEESDGYAEAWYLPAASNIQRYKSHGKWYERFQAKFKEKFGVEWEPGTATFDYPNEQDAATLWYHDHALGMTRLNVYAGPAGFYMLRGGDRDLVSGELPGPAPMLGDAAGTRYYEIPLAIQDRSFNADGSLFYPASREFFDEYRGRVVPQSDVPPIWNPEFFGNTMLVNGKTWPKLEVEPRRYRFRVLNGCNARYLLLKFSKKVPVWQIGAEGGFLPQPVELDIIQMSPAERADLIVDFAGLAEGTEITLLNVGPDEPFKGFNPDGTLSDGEGGSLEAAHPDSTGQVMKFIVVPLQGKDTSTPPSELVLPELKKLPKESNTRAVALIEEMSMFMEEADAIPVAAVLGTFDASGQPEGRMWKDEITETVKLNSTEIWEVHNFTADAHPIHIHEVMFEVVNRESMGDKSVRPPEPREMGRKDTFTVYPGEITRVKATFDYPGRYVWHCHIVEHEDNEMMRPYDIV